MTAKEYLERYRYLDDEILAKQEQITYLRTLISYPKIAVPKPTGGGGENSDGFSNTLIKLIVLEDKIQGDIDKLVKITLETIDTIDKVKPDKLKAILYKKYMSKNGIMNIGCPCEKRYMTLQEIADEWHYDVAYIGRLHIKALKKVDEIINKS